VIPLDEKTYKVSTRPDDRAVGGLSMGGGQTINIGFTRPELFRYIVILSAGSQNADTLYPGFFKDPAATNKQLKLLWVSAGKDDTAGPAAKTLDATLREGHRAQYVVTEGRRMDGLAHNLNEFAPLLFGRRNEGLGDEDDPFRACAVWGVLRAAWLAGQGPAPGPQVMSSTPRGQGRTVHFADRLVGAGRQWERGRARHGSAHAGCRRRRAEVIDYLISTHYPPITSADCRNWRSASRSLLHRSRPTVETAREQVAASSKCMRSVRQGRVPWRRRETGCQRAGSTGES
jgi:hypothetical protein